MSTHTWNGTVTGMTCGHCVASVTEEVQEIPGVEHVDVVLETGALTVTSAEPLDDDTVRSAVEEAGYQLA
jgi:copper chaperone